MLYELRIYDVAFGRMDDMLARARNHLLRLFARHDIPVVGCWEALTGARVPAFSYLVAWRDDAHRQAGWSGFYADPDWIRARAETNAGSELVERGHSLFLARGRSWEPAGIDGGTAVDGNGVHDLTTRRVAPGRAAAAHDAIATTVLPAVHAAGGAALGVFDVVAGPDQPSVLVFTRWPDTATWQRGMAAPELRGGASDALFLSEARTLWRPCDFFGWENGFLR